MTTPTFIEHEGMVTFTSDVVLAPDADWEDVRRAMDGLLRGMRFLCVARNVSPQMVGIVRFELEDQLRRDGSRQLEATVTIPMPALPMNDVL